MLIKSKSKTDLLACEDGPELVESASLGHQYAQTAVTSRQDLLNAQYLNGVLGRHLIYKQADEGLSTELLTKNVLLALVPKPIVYSEEHPEVEYRKKLMSLLDFLKRNETKLPALTFYTVIERVIEDFRPALLLQLFHNELRVVVKE